MLILAAGLTACNKDDIITDIDPETPSTPISPDTPEPSDTPDNPGYEPGSAGGLLVYEYTPAPGQFINEYTGDISAAEAAQWAATRLAEGKHVSLGAFGGYITVGFGHHIGDFVVTGNAFTNTGGSSNEPGIVYVMQDVNGNGLPDDEWYELRGSEWTAATASADYSVTYYRPAADGLSVMWSDSEGAEGAVDYIGVNHPQSSYYPAWLRTEAYTLRGRRLPAHHTQDPVTGFWSNAPYGWGYVDNTGEDLLPDGSANGFKISNAVMADGTPVKLEYIDFVKIQSGVLGQSGILGEISTEVTSVKAR